MRASDRRAREGPASQQRAAALWRLWVRALQRRGLPTTPADTTEDLLRRSSAAWPDDVEAVALLAELFAQYEQARFGARLLSATRARELGRRGRATITRLGDDARRRAA